MRRVIVPVLLLVTATLAAQQAAPEIDSIRKEEMRADLTFLASDAMRGRLTDTPENRLAAEWVAARFERLGLKPVGDANSFYQKYNLMTATASLSGPENQLGTGKAGQDFYPLRFSASTSATGDLAFVGFGISSPDRGYDDYRGDVKGKVVLAIDHEPGEADPDSPFDGIVTSQASDPLWKTLAAQEKGAAAILFVADVHNHQGPGAGGRGPGPGAGGQGPGTVGQDDAFARSAGNYWPAEQPRIPRFMLGAWVERVRIPAVQISPALAASLVEKTGKSLLDLAKSAESPKGSTPIALGTSVTVKTAVERKVIPDRNVVALLEGADPKLRDELVIVCAHYDHDGVNGENVLNGADDDGSGTVGVMEIAEAFALAAQKGQRPRRSILFAAWNSEERGLFGAWAYTESPLRPLADTVAVLNMDMIGRNEEVPEAGAGRFRGLEQQTAESNSNAVNIIGTTRSTSLKDAVERANRNTSLTLRLRYDNNASQLMRRSDHWPFLNRGVPAVWVHTGLHPDYHTPNDDADRINYEKMEKIGRLVYQAAWDLATAPTRPAMGTR
jgi:Zn-dependent M28 family amino/carboxypeptidase